MILTRTSIILLTCFLIAHRSVAQTDSTLPPSPAAVTSATLQDSGVRAAVHHRKHDSAFIARRDSLRRRELSRQRDSMGGRVLMGQRDSAGRRALAGQQDSASGRVSAGLHEPAATPVMGARKEDGADNGPPALVYWQQVLSADPYLAFTGRPVAEPFEIHQPNSKDSLFYLIVAILFYFAAVRLAYEKYFDNLLTLFFRVSLRQQQIREQVLQTPLPSLLLNILFILSAGLYACFLLHYSSLGAGVRFWVLYLDCMALLAAIYFVKFLVLKFTGWVFSISRATDVYIFVVFLVNKMMGIFLLPFLIVIIFSGQEWREVFITISLAMIFVLWGYRILASYRPVRNEIKLTPFYFFLYLCAFEIAPLLLIYKVLLTYLEKVY